MSKNKINIFSTFSNQDMIDCSICKKCVESISISKLPASSDKVTGHKTSTCSFCEYLERNISTSFNGICTEFEPIYKCKCGNNMTLLDKAYKYTLMTNNHILMTLLICSSCNNIKLMNISESNIENINLEKIRVKIIER